MNLNLLKTYANVTATCSPRTCFILFVFSDGVARDALFSSTSTTAGLSTAVFMSCVHSPMRRSGIKSESLVTESFISHSSALAGTPAAYYISSPRWNGIERSHGADGIINTSIVVETLPNITPSVGTEKRSTEYVAN